MGTLYLVRHGQASFGAADYDQLSALGQRQCQALGAWLAQRGQVFEAVLCGTLRRHAQSLSAITEGYASGSGAALPEALLWPGLNEYDGEALVRAVHPGEMADTKTEAGYRQHFRLLREGMTQWMAGTSKPAGMPPYADWVAGITGALDHVRQHCAGDVLMVTSGGPISTAVGHVLATPPTTTIELNLRIRNSSLTEFAYTPKRHMLLCFNHLPHLDGPQMRELITYS
jgi:broad specificity phosphatase PhoE